MRCHTETRHRTDPAGDLGDVASDAAAFCHDIGIDNAVEGSRLRVSEGAVQPGAGGGRLAAVQRVGGDVDADVAQLDAGRGDLAQIERDRAREGADIPRKGLAANAELHRLTVLDIDPLGIAVDHDRARGEGGRYQRAVVGGGAARTGGLGGGHQCGGSQADEGQGDEFALSVGHAITPIGCLFCLCIGTVCRCWTTSAGLFLRCRLSKIIVNQFIDGMNY